MKPKLLSPTLAGALAVLIAGCAHETRMIDENIPGTDNNRPDWTLTPPADSAAKAYFTGRSLAVNVLDERHGVDDAINDAIHQIARAAGADVTGRIVVVDNRTGDVIRGEENTDERSERRVEVDVNGTVIGIRQEDIFWERFSVREKTLGKRAMRYKCYVLVSVPTDEMERLKAEVKKKPRRN